MAATVIPFPAAVTLVEVMVAPYPIWAVIVLVDVIFEYASE